MTKTALSQQLRSARQRRGMTQLALAESSGVSRITIARLEGGSPQDVRAGTVTRLCRALGLEMTALPLGSESRQERMLARERERTRRAERRWGHAVLAARLLAAPRPEARALIAKARSVVHRWEQARLCSHHYISRWRKRLAGPVDRVARGLVEPDDWTDALFQNTPWSFALSGPHP